MCIPLTDSSLIFFFCNWILKVDINSFFFIQFKSFRILQLSIPILPRKEKHYITQKLITFIIMYYAHHRHYFNKFGFEITPITTVIRYGISLITEHDNSEADHHFNTVRQLF